MSGNQEFSSGCSGVNNGAFGIYCTENNFTVGRNSLTCTTCTLHCNCAVCDMYVTVAFHTSGRIRIEYTVGIRIRSSVTGGCDLDIAA